MIVNPTLDRQLPDDGPFLLWREVRHGGHEGLALVPSVCPIPGCTDRRILLAGHAMGAAVRWVAVKDGALCALGADGEPLPAGLVFTVAVELDTGAVEVVDPAWNRRAVAWLQGELDEELLTYLRRRFAAARAAIDPPVVSEPEAGADRGVRMIPVARRSALAVGGRGGGPLRAPSPGWRVAHPHTLGADATG